VGGRARALRAAVLSRLSCVALLLFACDSDSPRSATPGRSVPVEEVKPPARLELELPAVVPPLDPAVTRPATDGVVR